MCQHRFNISHFHRKTISHSNEKRENLLYRARRINEKNSKEIVYDLTFSLPKRRASECKLILKHNGTPKLNINDLSNIPNAKADIKDALNDTTGIGSGKLHFKSETKDFYLYRFYGYLEADADDSINVTLIDTAGLVMDTLKSPVGISEDIGHMNIISTIYALTAMPSGTTDPLNTDSIATLSDSAKLKLLITAMVDLSLAHNSPQPDENEQSQGIFTNYMQFMDNVVGKWDSIESASAGINRLERINDIIFRANRTKIIDPVYIKNHGTLTEYGLPVQKQQRKNYAFYEGYTRMHVDMELWPDSNRHARTGIGVMFRVSDNIELYGADLADTFNMFKKPFLRGDSLNRRIIFKSNDSILNKVDEDGLWVKGKDENNPQKQYYLGISPVRLAIRSLLNAKPVDSAFTIKDESACEGDPEGTIVGGAGKSILKMYELIGDTNSFDTIKNSYDPGTMLHGQWRRLELNKEYFDGDSLDFRMQTSKDDTGKIWLTNRTGFGVTLKDTSVLQEAAKVFSIIYRKIVVNGIAKLFPTNMFETSVLSRKIALKNAINSIEYQNAFDGSAYTWVELEEIKNPSDINKFINRGLRENGMFWFSGTGKFKIHRNDRTLSLSSIIFDSEESSKYSCKDWKDFDSEVLKYKTLWIEFKYVKRQNININFNYKHNTKSIQKEECVILDVDSDYNLKFSEIFQKIASLCDCKSGSEWNECRNEAYKITEKYFEMWGLYANDDSSWGIRFSPFRCQNKLDGLNDISSGWLCYQWAYFTHEFLNSIKLKYFSVQKSSIVDYAPDDPTSIIVRHNWITIFTCNPSNGSSTEDGIHLDPWVDARIKAFLAKEHETRMKELFPARDGKRNFYSTKLYPREVFKGWYINTFGKAEEVTFNKLFGKAYDW